MGYILIAAAGLWILIDTPRPLEGFWGPVVTSVWGASLFSALGAGIASFFARYRIEMVFIPFTFFGLAIFAFMSWSAVYFGNHSKGPQALAMTAFMLMMIVRYTGLMHLARRDQDPSAVTGPINIVQQGAASAREAALAEHIAKTDDRSEDRGEAPR